MNSHINSREFNWLVINTLVAAVGVGVAVIQAGRRLFTVAMPDAALFGVAVFAIGLLCYPIASIYLRQRRGRNLNWIRHVLGSIAGGCVAGLLHILLG